MNLQNLKNYLNECTSYGVPSGMSNTSILELVEQLEAALKDVEMMDWLSARLVCADFDYQDSGESVVVFEWPNDAPISADVRSSISSAMQSTD